MGHGCVGVFCADSAVPFRVLLTFSVPFRSVPRFINDRAPTQCVERMLGACKQMLLEKKTMHSTLFETYLPECIWRRKVDNFRDNPFN